MSKRNRENIDYNKLLAELQKNPKPSTPTNGEVRDAAADAKRIRKKLLKDPEMRFVYSTKNPVVHDKDCLFVSRIDDQHFRATEALPTEMETCRLCYRRALIRAGLSANTIIDFDLYYDALYRIGMTDEELFTLTVRQRAQFCGVGKNRVRIKLRDDTWEIRKNGDDLLLLHNNYSVTPNYERNFNGEFHIQMTCVARNGLGYFINTMCDYFWEFHAEQLKARDAAREAARAAEHEKQKRKEHLSVVFNFTKIKRVSLLYNYYIILDCDNKMMNYLYINKVSARAIGCEAVDNVYKLRYIRVPRKQHDLFVQAMDELKNYSLEQEFNDYADKCIEKLRDIKKINWTKTHHTLKILFEK